MPILLRKSQSSFLPADSNTWQINGSFSVCAVKIVLQLISSGMRCDYSRSLPGLLWEVIFSSGRTLGNYIITSFLNHQNHTKIARVLLLVFFSHITVCVWLQPCKFSYIFLLQFNEIMTQYALSFSLVQLYSLEKIPLAKDLFSIFVVIAKLIFSPQVIYRIAVQVGLQSYNFMRKADQIKVLLNALLAFIFKKSVSDLQDGVS